VNVVYIIKRVLLKQYKACLKAISQLANALGFINRFCAVSSGRINYFTIC